MRSLINKQFRRINGATNQRAAYRKMVVEWELGPHVCNMSPGERNGIVRCGMQHLRACRCKDFHSSSPASGSLGEKIRQKV